VRLLAYTSPARGHLNPMMGPLVELRGRGAEVHVRTLSSEVEAVRAAGLECEPLDPRIETIPHDDHEARSQVDSGRRSFATLAARARFEVPDLEAALEAVQPDAVLVDSTTFGAKAVAESSGLRWAESRPSLLEDPAPGVPPFGLGLRPRGGVRGRLRDGAFGLVHGWFDRKARLPAVNAGREAAGLAPLVAMAESRHRADLLLYFTAEPFEYPRPLPPSVVMVGASVWDTPAGAADPMIELPEDDRPLALVACSSEFQDDGAIAAAALAGLRDRWRLVVTTAGVDPAQLGGDHGDAVVARFLPHGPLLRQADAVVCHGGMGITQKALAAGVPVCVVPWGRDQLEVAAHVAEARAGSRVPRRRLTPERLAAAVERARGRGDGAARVAAGFEATGGSATAADALEALVPSPAP
jgi:UDP:flavonoid glycosyltransferase YjiC (YdhE family)